MEQHKLAAEFIQALITNTTKEFLMRQAGFVGKDPDKLTPAEVLLMAKAACTACTFVSENICPIINAM